jgi:hypothetical protein
MTDRAEVPVTLATLEVAARKVEAELGLARDLRGAGLHGFVRGREFAFAKEGARRNFRFDFSDPDLMVAIEVQGGAWMKPDAQGNRRGAHGTGTHIERDCLKATLAAALGWTVLFVTPAQIRKGLALSWIQLVVARRRAEGEGEWRAEETWWASVRRAFAIKNSSAAWGATPAGPSSTAAPVKARVMG